MISKRKKAFDIVSYIIIGIVFLLSIVGIIIKANKGTIYLFGKRADVVLSDSMSEKNEKYLDFLDGHDDQIQKMDLVVSTKVNQDSELSVYDIVLFDKPGLGTTMHRIVDKQIKSCDSAEVNNAQIVRIDGQSTFVLADIGSQFETSSISYNEVKVVIYSSVEYDDNYLFVGGTTILKYNIDTKQSGEYYVNTFTINKESSASQRFLITQAKEFDNSKFYLASVELTSSEFQINFEPNDFTKDDDKYICQKNIVYQYEIRGDKASESDGLFELKDIYSKVNYRIPKLGLFVRFITSIYGLILMIVTGFILVGTNVLIDYLNKKDNKKVEETVEKGEENNSEN